MDGLPLVGTQPVLPGFTPPSTRPIGRRLPRPALPGRCRGPEGALARANGLLVGTWQLATFPPVSIGLDPTWREDPLHDRNWQSKLHSLMPVLDLLEAWVVTGDARYYDRAAFILVDWSEENPRVGSPSEWSWNPLSAGLRGTVYACAAPYFPRAWMNAALDVHGEALSDPAVYAGEGNYALNQSIGLLEVGAARGRRDWEELAAARINSLIGRSVDAQGVTNEQSPAYGSYNLSRYRVAETRMVELGLPVAPEFSRLDLIPPFLAQATLPNGYLEQLGDTDYAPAPAWTGTDSEYVATAGRAGTRPDSPYALYDAGYLFARTGWGEDREFEDEVYTSLRFGPAPIIHGHADGTSLTYYGYGSRLLVDPGTYTYNSDAFRTFFKGRTAHNVVSVDGLAWNWAAPTTLVAHASTSTMIDATMTTSGYAGVQQQRHVTFSRNLQYLLVDDRATSTTARTFRQLWHLDDKAGPVLSADGFRTTHQRGNLLVRQLIAGSTTRVVSGATAPIQGWVSYTYGVKVPAPVVEVAKTGTSVRYLTLLVPAEGTPAATVSALTVTSTGYAVTVTVGSHAERVVVNGTAASITTIR
ncbi:MAG: heparinase II/III family protein [Chloroflexota bacterium]